MTTSTPSPAPASAPQLSQAAQGFIDAPSLQDKLIRLNQDGVDIEQIINELLALRNLTLLDELAIQLLSVDYLDEKDFKLEKEVFIIALNKDNKKNNPNKNTLQEANDFLENFKDFNLIKSLQAKIKNTNCHIPNLSSEIITKIEALKAPQPGMATKIANRIAAQAAALATAATDAKDIARAKLETYSNQKPALANLLEQYFLEFLKNPPISGTSLKDSLDKIARAANLKLNLADKTQLDSLLNAQTKQKTAKELVASLKQPLQDAMMVYLKKIDPTIEFNKDINPIQTTTYIIIQALTNSDQNGRENLLKDILDPNIAISDSLYATITNGFNQVQKEKLQATLKDTIQNLLLSKNSEFHKPDKVFQNYDLVAQIRHLRKILHEEGTIANLFKKNPAAPTPTPEVDPFTAKLDAAKNDNAAKDTILAQICFLERVLPSINSETPAIVEQAIKRLLPDFTNDTTGADNLKNAKTKLSYSDQYQPQDELLTKLKLAYEEIYNEELLALDDYTDAALDQQKRATLAVFRHLVNIRIANPKAFAEIIKKPRTELKQKQILAILTRKFPDLTPQNFADLLAAFDTEPNLDQDNRSYKLLPAIIKQIPEIIYKLGHFSAAEYKEIKAKTTAIQPALPQNPEQKTAAPETKQEPKVVINKNALNNWTANLFAHDLTKEAGIKLHQAILREAATLLDESKRKKLEATFPWLQQPPAGKIDNLIKFTQAKAANAINKYTQSTTAKGYFETRLKADLEAAFPNLPADSSNQALQEHLFELCKTIQNRDLDWASRLSDQDISEQLEAIYGRMQELGYLKQDLNTAGTIVELQKVIKGIPYIGGLISRSLAKAYNTNETPTKYPKPKLPNRIGNISSRTNTLALKFAQKVIEPSDKAAHPLRTASSNLLTNSLETLANKKQNELISLKRYYQALSTIAHFRGIDIDKTMDEKIQSINPPTYAESISSFIENGIIPNAEILAGSSGIPAHIGHQFQKYAAKQVLP
jgi:hypothetical protein